MTARDIPDSQAAKWVKFLGATLIFPMAFGLFTWNLSLDRRVTRIEANRFTEADGAALIERMNNKADRDEVPPPEVVVRLDRLEEDLREVKRDVKELLRQGG